MKEGNLAICFINNFFFFFFFSLEVSFSLFSFFLATFFIMMSWQPQQQSLRELLVLLRDAADPNNREQALINQVKKPLF